MSLTGKNIVIVGGTSGIGEQVVHKAIEAGAQILNISRRENTLPKVYSIKQDITLDFEKPDWPFDRVDGLVYAPGSINLKPITSLSPEDFLKEFNLNVLGFIRVFKHLIPLLRKSESPSVVGFSTVAVAQGMSYHAGIATSKAALQGLFSSLAAEYAKNNFRFNIIAPSLTSTPLAGHLLNSDEKIKSSQDRHPIKGIGSPDELADIALFLLGSSTRWMTGQVLNVDGGLSSLRPL